MAVPSRERQSVQGNLPVFKTEFGSLMWNLGTNTKALKVTCPRPDCGKVFYLIDPGQTKTRACPHCFRVSKHV